MHGWQGKGEAENGKVLKKKILPLEAFVKSIEIYGKNMKKLIFFGLFILD